MKKVLEYDVVRRMFFREKSVPPAKPVVLTIRFCRSPYSTTALIKAKRNFIVFFFNNLLNS